MTYGGQPPSSSRRSAAKLLSPVSRYTSLAADAEWPMRAMVGVAQLVERRVVVADVAGSSPVTHPKASLSIRR